MWKCPNSKYPVRLILAAAVLLFTALCVYVYDFFIDDTFISLRFAKNLVDYGQLSFNPGDVPIEGYTNFLLVLFEAFFIKAGVENVIHIPKIIGILSGIIVVILTYKISSRLMPDEAGWLKFLPVFAVAVSPSLTVWAVGGLETDLYLLFLLSGFYYFISYLETSTLRDALGSDLSFMLAFLTRPDAILLWAIGYLFLVLFFRKVGWRNKLYSMLVSAVLVSIYMGWKYLYFGSLLPTTFSAKVDGLTVNKLREGLLVYYLFIKSNLNYLYFALLPVTAWALRKKLFSGLTYCLLMFIGFSAYVIYLGNPVMAHIYRFHVPLIPILYITGTYGFWTVMNLKWFNQFRFREVLVVVLCVIQVATGAYELYYYRNIDFGWFNEGKNLSMNDMLPITEFNCNLGQWIKDTFPPQTVIAVGDVGGLGYYSDGKVIDTWSLMDRNIIEMRKEQNKYPMGSKEFLDIEQNQIARYVLDQNPGLIFLDFVDYSADPRADKYIMFTDMARDDKPLFIREDLLFRPPGSQDLRLSQTKSGFAQ